MIKLYIQKTDLFSPLNFCSGKQEDGYRKSEDTCRDDSVLRKVLTQISGAFFRLQDPPVSPEAAPSASEDANAPVPRRPCRSPSCAFPRPRVLRFRSAPRLTSRYLSSLRPVFLSQEDCATPRPAPLSPRGHWQHLEAFGVLTAALAWECS